jgi:hypothetical protein
MKNIFFALGLFTVLVTTAFAVEKSIQIDFVAGNGTLVIKQDLTASSDNLHVVATFKDTFMSRARLRHTIERSNYFNTKYKSMTDMIAALKKGAVSFKTTVDEGYKLYEVKIAAPEAGTKERSVTMKMAAMNGEVVSDTLLGNITLKN